MDRPKCPDCGCVCVRNGWDLLSRKGLVGLKIGRFKCSCCGLSLKKDLSFWNHLIGSWEATLADFFLRLSDRDVALRAISTIMEFINPLGKGSISRRVSEAIRKLAIPQIQSKYRVVHYDEQHPKKCRHQKFRLTLIDALTNNVLADELVDDKERETVKNFLTSNLDLNKETIMITDDFPMYSNLFEEVWGDKVKHQLCLLHLNKLVVGDCGKVKNLQEMYNTYLLLNIFFDRSKELSFLQVLLSEEQKIENSRRQKWNAQSRKRFNNFVRNLEKMRRRNKENHKLHTLSQAEENFNKLLKEKQLLPKKLKKRLNYIANRWDKFTLFHKIKDCPHTNNTIENYFSTSLKTHRKKQFRTDKGIKNKIKLSIYKRNQGFGTPQNTFLKLARTFYILNQTQRTQKNLKTSIKDNGDSHPNNLTNNKKQHT